MRKLRKGFTLIELLVVIAILAALSAAMAISSSGAVASAKAASIISNLQTIKTAALVFYNDYREQSGDADFSEASFNNVSKDYLDETTIKMMDKDGRYALKIIANGTGASAKPQEWYVGYALDASETDNIQVVKKLIARADRLGLTGGKATAPTASNAKYGFTTSKIGDITGTLATTSTAVWMRVR